LGGALELTKERKSPFNDFKETRRHPYRDRRCKKLGRKRKNIEGEGGRGKIPNRGEGESLDQETEGGDIKGIKGLKGGGRVR